MLVNLCEGLLAEGCEVDLVLVKTKSEHLAGLSSQVRVVKLNAGHTFSSVLRLAAYLRRNRPSALLAAKDRAGKVAVVARRLAGVRTRVVFRIGTTPSAALEGKSFWRKLLWYVPMRLIYPRADGIVAVSGGVAQDLAHITHLPETRFHVIANPVITPRLESLAKEPTSHPWFSDHSTPIILGIGRLTRQKDFPTLLRAFSIVRKNFRCRLVILGEGGSREGLEALAAELGVSDDVSMPGFVANPYSYLRKAALFVLSSAWEGSPNVLTEALALGVPVVATDCPSGPREILQSGNYGLLVPVGDAVQMAKAMLETISAPLAKGFLRQATIDYTMEKSSRRYLEVLLGQKINN